jgi:hypothetical protein
MARQYPELGLLYAIPNAARRGPALASWMKAEGLRAGVPDLCLPVPRLGYHGLYIEMKREGGNGPTKDQRCFLRCLGDQGYLAVCCWGADQAKRLLLRYVRGEALEIEDAPKSKKPRDAREWLRKAAEVKRLAETLPFSAITEKTRLPRSTARDMLKNRFPDYVKEFLDGGGDRSLAAGTVP